LTMSVISLNSAWEKMSLRIDSILLVQVLDGGPEGACKGAQRRIPILDDAQLRLAPAVPAHAPIGTYPGVDIYGGIKLRVQVLIGFEDYFIQSSGSGPPEVPLKPKHGRFRERLELWEYPPHQLLFFSPS